MHRRPFHRLSLGLVLVLFGAALASCGRSGGSALLDAAPQNDASAHTGGESSSADAGSVDSVAALNPVFDAGSLPMAAASTLDPDPLPIPSRPPGDPYEQHEVEEIGRIQIPAVGLTHPVVEGITLTSINVAPGHWPGSAMPGQRGNTVFPGHRTTYTRPFGDLDLLASGDEIVFEMPDGTHTYEVVETLIVAPTDMWVVDQTETSTVTLIACHPKGSAAQRIVVKGELVSSVPSLGAIAAAGAVARVGDQAPI